MTYGQYVDRFRFLRRNVFLMNVCFTSQDFQTCKKTCTWGMGNPRNNQQHEYTAKK